MTTVTPGAVELKPCPFCWGETKIIAPLGFGNVRAVDCRNDECSATGPWARNEAEAIAAWNTRATPPDALQTVVEAWLPIESAPKDGTPFLAAIYVRHNDEPRRWDIHVIGYDAAYDEMNSDFETGWEIEDYAFWMPLPKPPALSLAGGDV